MCILCSYRNGNNVRLSMLMHTRTGEKPFICSICSKQSTRLHGCMAVWIHGKMDSWQFGSMAKWIHGSLDSLQNGFMAVWIHGTMDEYSLDSWHNGCIAVWIHDTMDVWQFGCMVFSKTSPRHLWSSKIKTHYVRSPSYTVKAKN